MFIELRWFGRSKCCHTQQLRSAALHCSPWDTTSEQEILALVVYKWRVRSQKPLVVQWLSQICLQLFLASCPIISSTNSTLHRQQRTVKFTSEPNWVHDCFSKAAARPWKCNNQPSLRRLGAGSSKTILILVLFHTDGTYCVCWLPFHENVWHPSATLSLCRHVQIVFRSERFK